LRMDLLPRGNDALKVNPVMGVDEALAVHGSDWLWAVTAVFCLALVRLRFDCICYISSCS
jgi:bacteriorhodopsin